MSVILTELVLIGLDHLENKALLSPSPQGTA
jgi:hypothetical protein